MDFYELLDKDFEIITLKKLNVMQENIDKTKKIRKIMHE